MEKNRIKVPADLSKFWVITCISNPKRYKRRYELYWRFAQMCEDAGVNLITVEQAFGAREFMVTDPNNRHHLQVRSVEELWLKENMINLGVEHACHIAPDGGVREVAWIDADCFPARTPREWFEETWHALQHYEIVQMWEQMIDLDPNQNQIGKTMPSFMANYLKYGSPNHEEFHRIECQDGNYPNDPKKTMIFGRPGLAWAANVDAFNKVGGLLDFCILGAGDYYQAHGLVGSLKTAGNEHGNVPGPYFQKLLNWQERAQRWIKRDVGYVPGLVMHEFHGKKVNRQYGTRGKILGDAKYNPDLDIKRDAQGLFQLETWDEHQIILRDRIRAYFLQRNEDSIDVD